MRPIKLDRSHYLLGIMILLCAVAIFSIATVFRADEISRAIKGDKTMNILFVIEQDKHPGIIGLFMFHPSTGKSAYLDIPGETGMILESLKRVDRIESAYDPTHPSQFSAEVSRLVGLKVDSWMILNEKNFVQSVDLLEGLEVFIPAPVNQSGPPAVYLPGGAVLLDGDKALQYALYSSISGADDSEALSRRQKLFQSFLRRISQRSEILRRKDMFSAFSSGIDTNLSRQALLRFFARSANIDTDRIVFQKITGSYRMVDEKRMLFAHYDGELVKDIVRQTVSALSNAETPSSSGKTYTLEILNGSESKGLARQASEIYQSFGYDVVSMGNADRTDYERTVIVDRFGDPSVVKTVGSVIKCENFSVRSSEPSVVADFTIILGKDFNGRYCARQ